MRATQTEITSGGAGDGGAGEWGMANATRLAMACGCIVQKIKPRLRDVNPFVSEEVNWLFDALTAAPAHDLKPHLGPIRV